MLLRLKGDGNDDKSSNIENTENQAENQAETAGFSIDSEIPKVIVDTEPPSLAESTDTIKVCTPSPRRPKSDTSIFSIPKDSFQAQEPLHVTSLLNIREGSTSFSRKNSISPSNSAELPETDIFGPEIRQEIAQKMAEKKDIIKCTLIIVVPILILSIVLMSNSFHMIDEGHVGIYFRQGALMVIENKLRT